MSKVYCSNRIVLAWAVALAAPSLVAAQVPVDESGAPLASAEISENEIPLLSTTELQDLVGPIALYPDDLLAIVLPASTYPLQLVQADRFIQDLKSDPELKPDEAWDDSIVALLNYPEAIALMTRDLDKTWRLGEAVVAQQADVIAAIETFRDQAYEAGNLMSDDKQTVAENDGVIEITPVEEDVIYVPYYEPEEVVVYQPRPVYYYYPRAYPVYYYPYPYGYRFSYGFFWGVTTAFTVGWWSDSVHVYHPTYYGHPYYGRYYGYNYWYRRPSITVYNNYYSNNNYVHNRHGHGDYWRPHSRSTVNHHNQRVTRSRHYPGSDSGHNGRRSAGYSGTTSTQRLANHATQKNQPVKFRQRTSTTTNQSSSIRPSQARAEKNRNNPRQDIGQDGRIEFRDRSRTTTAGQSTRNRQASRSPSRTQGSSESSRSARANNPRASSQKSSPTRPSGQQRAQREARDTTVASQSRVRRQVDSRPSQNNRSRSETRQPSRAQAQPRQSSRASAPKRQSSQKSSPNRVARTESRSRDRGNSRRR